MIGLKTFASELVAISMKKPNLWK